MHKSTLHSSSFSSAFPAISLGFTIFDEIFASVTVFKSNQSGSHIPSLWIFSIPSVFHTVCLIIKGNNLSII